MHVMTAEEACENFDEVMRRAVDDCMPVAIARTRAEAVVVVAKSEWDALHETLHVLGSPENARRLREGIAELDAGRGIERDLIDA